VKAQLARNLEVAPVTDHSLETKIALLELQVKNLADALLVHMEQEGAAMERINTQLQNLQKSAWVVSNIERLGWVIVAAAVAWIMKG
jgi:hypothetical protein